MIWACFGTFYVAALLAPVVLKDGSILRVGEANYYRLKDNHEMHKAYNLRGLKDPHDMKDVRDFSKRVLESTSNGEEPGILRIASRKSGISSLIDRNTNDEVVAASTISTLSEISRIGRRNLRLHDSVRKRRTLEDSKDVLSVSFPKSRSSSSFSFIEIFYSDFEWILETLHEIRDSEMALTLIFILSTAISFAVGLILSLHIYLGDSYILFRIQNI